MQWKLPILAGDLKNYNDAKIEDNLNDLHVLKNEDYPPPPQEGRRSQKIRVASDVKKKGG